MAIDRTVLTWAEVEHLAIQLAGRWREKRDDLDGVWGVPRGGVAPAVMVAHHLGLPLVDDPTVDTLVVDDVVDSGATREKWGTFPFDALVCKPTSPPWSHQEPPPLVEGWVVLPWEVGTPEEHGPTDAVVRLLEHIGEDPNRDGLVDTPGRVVKALTEMTVGYHEDPAAILATTFDEKSDEMVIVRGVEFTSMCEHHMLPFTGTVSLGYLPGERVVGLSKLARLVECYARRLQVQERMTAEIAEAIQTHLGATGVGVVVTARHSCMGCRGVKKPTAEMVTSAMLGSLRSEPAARAEFLHLTRV